MSVQLAEPPPQDRHAELPGLASCSLVPHCVLLGLAGGWLTADVLGLGQYDTIRWVLTVVTPLVSAGLGHYLSSRLQTGPLPTALLVLTSVGVAGFVNGILVGFSAVPPMGMVVGMFFGLICCIPFIPAIGAVAFTARRVGRARVRSIVDLADRRAVWLATWMILAIAGSMPLPFVEIRGSASAVIPVASVGFILILLALDLGAFVRTGALRACLSSIRATSQEGNPDSARAAVPVVDFGLGDEDLQETAPSGAVYRDRARALRVFRGSADRARAALGRSIAVDLAVLLLAAFCALSRGSDLRKLPDGLVPPSSNLLGGWD
jgi:hypothetical protein